MRSNHDYPFVDEVFVGLSSVCFGVFCFLYWAGDVNMTFTGKSFRMVMTQYRKDLFWRFFEKEEFRHVKTATQLIEAVFNGYDKLKRENERIKQNINDLITKASK